jgi:hypothetical protein
MNFPYLLLAPSAIVALSSIVTGVAVATEGSTAPETQARIVSSARDALQGHSVRSHAREEHLAQAYANLQLGRGPDWAETPRWFRAFLCLGVVSLAGLGVLALINQRPGTPRLGLRWQGLRSRHRPSTAL